MKRFLAALAFVGFFSAAHAQQGTVIQPPSCAIAGCTMTGALTVSGASLITSGNFSAAAWTTSGIRNVHAAASYTDTSSTGTVAAAYTDLFGASTILASSATVYTQYYGAYFKAPVASTNVTMTNKSALGADTVSVGGAAQSTFALAVTGTANISGNLTSGGQLQSGTNVYISLDAGQLLMRAAADTRISSPATATIQFGAADGAVAVAQTFRVQSVVAGTAAANGADWTVIGSLGTGTGTPGKMTFQVGVAQASGTAQSTATTALQLVGAASGSLPTVLMPGLANTATTSAICYNTSTGLLTYDGTIGTCNTSTMRVKHDIAALPQPSMLAGVMRMEPVSFFYNDDQRTPGQQIGFIAEQLEEVDPRLVAYDDTGKPNAIRFLGPMFSYVVGAIKELKADNDNLRADLAIMKKASGDRR